jgi:HEAT repeat protein
VAAARALSRLGASDAIPEIEATLKRSYFVETRRDVAVALAGLGSAAGIQELFQGLDNSDDLVRESMFLSFFSVTGLYLGYDPMAPRPERLAAIGRLQAHWAKSGGAASLHKAFYADPRKAHRAWNLIKLLNENGNAAEDDKAVKELVGMGRDAVPSLIDGLRYPPGFAAKIARICDALGQIGDKSAAPHLVAALRSPVIGITLWAVRALESAGDAASVPSLVRYRDRILSLDAAGKIPDTVGTTASILAAAARTRLALGDESAREELRTLNEGR